MPILLKTFEESLILSDDFSSLRRLLMVLETEFIEMFVFIVSELVSHFAINVWPKQLLTTKIQFNKTEEVICNLYIQLQCGAIGPR